MPDLVLPVISVRRATPATRIVRVDLQGKRFPYAAGQAAMIGPPDIEERVPYSIASAPADTAADGALEFLVKVDAASPWGSSFPVLRRGMRLAVLGPYGSCVFPEHPAERRFLFIAGGTGIAPMRSMIRHAMIAGYAGALSVLYSARSRDEFAYLPELRGMARRGEITLALTVTRDLPNRWRGGRGRIAAAQLAPLVDDAATLCFVCGPSAMIVDVPPMLMALGVERQRIRIEEW